MFLKYRPARFSDLDKHIISAREVFAYDADEQRQVVQMWKDLLFRKQVHCPVIEDCTPGTGLGCVFACLIVFLKDDFADDMTTEAAPISSKYLLKLWREDKLPFLTEKQIKIANSTRGLNVLILSSGVSVEAIQAGKILLMGSKLVEFHPYALNGFRLNRVYIEMYDDVSYNWAETFGYYRLTDYKQYFQSSSIPPPGQRPVLYGINAEQAAAKVGAGVTMMFHYDPPRFRFKPTEQELLLWAMSADNDEQLSTNLNVSFETTKKRWGNIYARVQDIAPEIFNQPDNPGDGLRGSEKRRNLLSYLRHHMEELRPFEEKRLPI